MSIDEYTRRFTIESKKELLSYKEEDKELDHEKYTLLKKKYFVWILEKVEWYKDVKESEKYKYQDLDEESIDLRLKIPSLDWTYGFNEFTVNLYLHYKIYSDYSKLVDYFCYQKIFSFDKLYFIANDIKKNAKNTLFYRIDNSFIPLIDDDFLFYFNFYGDVDYTISLNNFFLFYSKLTENQLINYLKINNEEAKKKKEIMNKCLQKYQNSSFFLGDTCYIFFKFFLKFFNMEILTLIKN